MFYSSSSDAQPLDLPRSPTPGQRNIAGCVFLAASPGSAAEYTVGVGVLPQFASGGLATYAVADVLQKAFGALGAYRVEARVLHADACAQAIRTFVHLGFMHEGIRRRAAPGDQDVSVLALLDTNWQVRRHVRPRALSLWDEMLERQQRESDLLILAVDIGRSGRRKLKQKRSVEAVSAEGVHARCVCERRRL